MEGGNMRRIRTIVMWPVVPVTVVLLKFCKSFPDHG